MHPSVAVERQAAGPGLTVCRRGFTALDCGKGGEFRVREESVPKAREPGREARFLIGRGFVGTLGGRLA